MDILNCSHYFDCIRNSTNLLVESVKNAIYVSNRLPDAGGVSPFEKLFGRATSMSKHRLFGCLTYILLDESERKSLDIYFKKESCLQI
jgi:hypothetical protein